MGAMAKPAVLFKLDAKAESQNTMSGVGQHWPCLEVHQPSTCSWVWGSWGTAGALGVGSAPLQLQELACTLTAPGLCLSCRLIKGDGEVLEEIVSKERHKEINKVVGTVHGVAGHSQGGVVFPAWGQLSPGSTARAPRVVLVVLQPWAGSAVSAVSPLQQATRGDGLAFQVRTGMLQ